MNTSRFDIAGIQLNAAFEDTELVEPLLGLIGEWQVADPVVKDADYSILLQRSDVPATAGPGRFIYRGKVEGIGPFEFTGDTTGLEVLAAGEILAQFFPAEKEVRIQVSTQCEEEKLGIISSYAIDQALSRNNCCMVHAACLETPDGKGRVILHAPSGTGKSTTSMALVALGYRLCSDDMTVLGPLSDAPMSASGLPRAFKVPRKTAETVRWLSTVADPDEWDENGEQWIARKALSDLGLLGGTRPLPLRSVIALRRTGGPGGISALCGADAMMELMSDNISLGPDGLFPGHDQRLNLYSRALADADRYLVHIDGEPQAVARLIHNAISEGQA